MANLTFSHSNKRVGTLEVSANPDTVFWAYNLNTQTYPTYGGEVVQILSVYINDLTIQGSVSSQQEMADIYTYFADYMSIASQGDGTNSGRYIQKPMTMTYSPRGWTFEIQPLSAPGFWQGRDQVVPQWGITAHVVDNTGDGLRKVKEILISQGLDPDNPADVSGTFTLSAMISNSGDPNKNPFQTFQSNELNAGLQTIQKDAEYYNSLIPAYLGGDFSSLWSGIGSSPSFGSSGLNKPNQQKSLPNTKASKVKK